MALALARTRSPADAGEKILEQNRWIEASMGSYKSGSRIKEIQGFRLSGTGAKAQRDGSPSSGERSRDRKPEDNNHVAGSPDQNAGAGEQRKRERFQSSKQIDRGLKEKDRRVGETTAESVTPKKSPVVRKKKKVKEAIAPRL